MFFASSIAQLLTEGGVGVGVTVGDGVGVTVGVGVFVGVGVGVAGGGVVGVWICFYWFLN